MGVLQRSCPTREVVDRLADTWTILVVLVLADGPRRFGGLRRAVEGISPRMLTATLRRLERDGLVVRRAYATSPPSVEYGLTPIGRSLLAAFGAMRDWSETHWEGIMRARDVFDRAPADAGRSAGAVTPGAAG